MEGITYVKTTIIDVIMNNNNNSNYACFSRIYLYEIYLVCKFHEYPVNDIFSL